MPTPAGFAKVEITPPLDRMEVYGLGYWYQRAVRFRAVRDPLYARAFVLGQGAACQVVVSVDIILDTYDFIPQAQHRIAKLLDISPGNVFITCTHTHSSPLVEVNRTRGGVEYGPFLVDRVVQAGVQAFEKREPARAELRRGRVEGAVRNRRPLLKSGRIAELHAPLDPADVADPGPVNDNLTLVEFREESGTRKGALCHFGIHGVAIQCSELISSDCMGRAIQRVEEDGAVVLHLNAPCGDIDPVAMGDEPALEAMTERLYTGIVDVSQSAGRPVPLAPQQSVAGTFRASRRSTRSREVLLAEKERLAQAGSDDALRHHSGAGYERFLIEEESAVAEMPEEFDIPYQIFRAGDLVLIGVGGEIFTRFGQQLATVDERLHVLPVGITGASFGYLPGAEMFAQGGYEVSNADWCRIAPGETERLFAEIIHDTEAMTR